MTTDTHGVAKVDAIVAMIDAVLDVGHQTAGYGSLCGDPACGCGDSMRNADEDPTITATEYGPAFRAEQAAAAPSHAAPRHEDIQKFIEQWPVMLARVQETFGQIAERVRATVEIITRCGYEPDDDDQENTWD